MNQLIRAEQKIGTKSKRTAGRRDSLQICRNSLRQGDGKDGSYPSSGSRILNFVPAPNLDETRMFPPQFPTIVLAI